MLATGIDIVIPANPREGDNIPISALLFDQNQQPVVGATIDFGVNGPPVGVNTAATEANGAATIFVVLEAGSHTVTATFLGGNGYGSSTSGPVSFVVVAPASP